LRLPRFVRDRLEDKPIHQIPVFFPFHPLVCFYTRPLPEELIYPVHAKIPLGAGLLALIVPSAIASSFPDSGPVIHGKKARIYLADQAAAPKKAPPEVKLAIWAGNQLCSKRYCYGGGHRSFDDVGYDCSGTISYVLGAAGLISSP
jgi:hypothetical protein